MDRVNQQVSVILKKQLKGARASFGSQCRGTVHHEVRKARQQQLGAAGQLVSAIRKQRMMNAGTQPVLSFLCTRDPSLGNDSAYL